MYATTVKIRIKRTPKKKTNEKASTKLFNTNCHQLTMQPMQHLQISEVITHFRKANEQGGNLHMKRSISPPWKVQLIKV